MIASEILMLIGSMVISTLKGPARRSERLIKDSDKQKYKYIFTYKKNASLTYILVPRVVDFPMVGEASLHDVGAVPATRLQVWQTLAGRASPHLLHCSLTLGRRRHLEQRGDLSFSQIRANVEIC